MIVQNSNGLNISCQGTTLQPNLTIERARKIEQLRQQPKFNSHCHLGGEIPIAFIKKFATDEQLEAIEKGFAEIAKGKKYEDAFFIFPLISEVINTHEKLIEGTYQTCKKFQDDNNQLVLMRTGLKVLENKSYEDYLISVLEGIKKAKQEFLQQNPPKHFSLLLMLSIKRSSDINFAKTTIDLALKYQAQGVIGIDISDISTQGNIKPILPEIIRGKDAGLKIAVHMGESPNETDQMLIINSLKPDVIDHGVNLCDEARDWVNDNKVPVTVCLTSSLVTKMHPEDQLHPQLVNCLNHEHPTHFGTDDSTVFGDTSLTEELYKLHPQLDVEQIVEIAEKSFQNAQLWFEELQVCKL